MPNSARKSVCVSLPDTMLDLIDAESRTRQQPRSYIVQAMLERAMAAGRATLQDIEHASRSGSAAAAAHLREHRRLSGMRPPQED